MKTKTLVISAVAIAAVLGGGWALAQSGGPPSGFGPPFMHGQGRDGMGPGMMQGMRGHGPGMMKGMDHGQGHGPGMMKGVGGHGPGMMKGPGMMHGQRGAAFADPAQLDTLKGELGIAAAQQTAWSKYATAVQDAAAATKAARESVDPQAVRKMSPSDRFAFVTKMREQRQKQFGAVRSAADELFATLDATQKAKAAEVLPGLAFGPAMRGAFAGDQQHKH